MKQLRALGAYLVAGVFAFTAGTWYAAHNTAATVLYLILAVGCTILAIAQ